MEIMRLPARLESLEPLLSFVIERVEHLELPRMLTFDIRLVMEEILTNIIHYAYSDREGDVEVEYKLKSGSGLHLQIRDWGRPFNPLEHEPPDLTVDLEDREIGGLGIYLTRQFADDVRYRRNGHENTLELFFRL